MRLRLIKLVKKPFIKFYDCAKGINDALQSPTKIGNAANNGIEYITKITGATTGAAGAAKGASDACEALACQDGVCFVISCIGTTADALQICASFVPGPNVTALVTTPISVGCKVFVWCCKRSKLPWGSC
jgi:hypothetical protein